MDYVFQSMKDGYTPATFYVNDDKKPSVSMCVQKNTCYVTGEPTDEAFTFLKDKIIKEKREEGVMFLKIIPSTDEWRKKLSSLEINVYGRVLFQHDFKQFYENNKLNGIDIKEINSDLLLLKNANAVIDEVKGEWGSVESFLNNGFGFCAVKETEIIGWCTAEFMSATACGVGIETVEEYQNQGLASSLAATFVEKCKERDLTPHWDSWKWNEASVKVAKKTGFQDKIDYEALMLPL